MSDTSNNQPNPNSVPAPATAANPASAPAPSPAPGANDPAASSAGNNAGKPAQEPSQAKPSVPDKYELKMPEGSLLGQGYQEKVAEFAKQLGLSNEHAQKLLERENGVLADFAKAQTENHNKLVEAWAKEVQNDKEIGGENFKKNVELAHRVVKRFASDEFLQGLKDTGFGNHPEFVRVFTRIGKAMSEDQLVVPGATPAPKKELHDILYPSSKN